MATPKRSPARKEESEYDEFQKLAKKLVRVPKHEIDAERAKTKAKKPAR